MQEFYFILAALHLVAIVVSGALWAVTDYNPASILKNHKRDIMAVHFGSLFLVPFFIALDYAFNELNVPGWERAFFPAGLGMLVALSSISYLFPVPPGKDPFYYWTTPGWPRVFSMAGIACVVFGVLWTAGVLIYHSLTR